MFCSLSFRRYYEESRKKCESEKEKVERREREQFCSELFFSFISPELESTLPGSQTTSTLSSETDEGIRLEDGAERIVEITQSDSSQSTLVGDLCGENSSAQAASSSTSNIVVSKGRNGYESDCVYNSDSETRSARP